MKNKNLKKRKRTSHTDEHAKAPGKASCTKQTKTNEIMTKYKIKQINKYKHINKNKYNLKH